MTAEDFKLLRVGDIVTHIYEPSERWRVVEIDHARVMIEQVNGYPYQFNTSAKYINYEDPYQGLSTGEPDDL